MDYSFAPGRTGFDRLIRRLFNLRDNTTPIATSRARNTVREFITHMDGSAAVTKPIENMLLGTHANAQGYLAARLFDNQIGATGYEVMEDSISGRHTSDATPPDTTRTAVTVPDPLIGYTPGDPVINNFHIKGCNVGKATAFLQKMKEALGSNVNVTAPVHFYGLYSNSGYGIWEFMAYEFRLYNKTAFANRAAYIAALDAKGFTFYNGDPVAVTDWEAWVPRAISRTSRTALNPGLGTPIGRRRTISTRREFRYKKEDYTFTIRYSSASQVPTTAAAQMTALENSLDTAVYRSGDTVMMFDAGHPYPEYERWGYTSKQEFLDEHQWRFQKSGKKLICKGRFHGYTLLVPITDRDPANAGNIIFNFHPNAGSAHSAITTGLVETDASFFATV